jgi:hypothetical protein
VRAYADKIEATNIRVMADPIDRGKPFSRQWNCISTETSAIKFDEGTAKIKSNNWSVAQHGRDHLIKAIIAGVRVTEERSRFRTKLAR